MGSAIRQSEDPPSVLLLSLGEAFTEKSKTGSHHALSWGSNGAGIHVMAGLHLVAMA